MIPSSPHWLSLFLIIFLISGGILSWQLYTHPPFYLVGDFGIDNQTVIDKIVREDLSPLECLKIKVFRLGPGPAQGEVIASCIDAVARGKKDPAICEYLMPSEFGMSCVADAQTKQPCEFNSKGDTVWIENEQAIGASLHECFFSSVQSKIGQECCIINKVDNLSDFNDCSSLKIHSSMYDLCNERLDDSVYVGADDGGRFRSERFSEAASTVWGDGGECHFGL